MSATAWDNGVKNFESELPATWLDQETPPVVVCFLGVFRVRAGKKQLSFPTGGKVECLLGCLALHRDTVVDRSTLIDQLWPESDPRLAPQSLHTLIYSLNRLLGPSLSPAPAILRMGTTYALNRAAGIAIDIDIFESLLTAADEAANAQRDNEARTSLRRAVEWYKGDLCISNGVEALVERERLRARYLSAVTRIAQEQFEGHDYAGALKSAGLVLNHDPCREDAHRMMMQCYVRLGQRSQALRQFRLCEQIMQREFEASVEPATTSLYDLVRQSPQAI